MKYSFLKSFFLMLFTLFLVACGGGEESSSGGDIAVSSSSSAAVSSSEGTAQSSSSSAVPMPTPGDEASSEASSVATAYDVRVERGFLLEGTVKDNSGQTAVQKDKTQPVYTFALPPVPPVRVTGGWIDINRNGVKDGFDFDFSGEMHSCNGEVVTPLTSLVPDSCTLADVETTYQAYRGIISPDLDLSELSFFSETVSGMDNLAFTLFTNAVYRGIMAGESSYAEIDDEYIRLKAKAAAFKAAFPDSDIAMLIEIESTKDIEEVELADGALEALYHQLRAENCTADEMLVPVDHTAAYDPALLAALFADQKDADLLTFSECVPIVCDEGYLLEEGACVMDADDCSWQPEAPVCGLKSGSDVTYDKTCLLEADGATLQYTGSCVVCDEGYFYDAAAQSCVLEAAPPQECTALYDPVCGEKTGTRQTYANQCELETAGAVKLLDDVCSALTCPTGEELNAAFFCEAIQCDVTEVLVGDTCVLKECDPGFVLLANGSCQCADTSPVVAVDGASCESFADECSVPSGWTIVSECPSEPITYSVTDNPSDIVNAHNFYRAEVFSGYQLSWDSGLEQDAQNWADYLAVNYTEADRLGGASPHASMFEPELHDFDKFQGENIYMSSQLPNQVAMVSAIELFASEKAYYTYETNSCASGQICGHYTQIVWKNTSYVGCAEAQMLYNSPFNTVVVCRYYTPGNYIGQWPY